MMNDKYRYRLLGLTNWSNETFQAALERFYFLSCFDGIFVSGTEKMKTPDPKIYKLTLDLYSVIAKNDVFNDDKLQNMKADLQLGIHGINFTKDAKLKKDLKGLGVS